MQIKLFFIVFLFLCFATRVKAQRFVSKVDTINNFEETWSISFGYSSIPTQFDEASVYAEVPQHPLIDESLPGVNVNGGYYVALLYHYKENWYFGFSFSDNTVNPPERPRDKVSSFGFNFGYQLQLTPIKKDYFLAFGVGIASFNARRGLVGLRDYNSVRLISESVSFTPSIRFDVNLFNEILYLFSHVKYFYNFQLI